MDSKLFLEILKRVKAVAGIKTLLVFSMATLNLSVMTWRVGTDQLVANTQLVSSELKKGGNITLAV